MDQLAQTLRQFSIGDILLALTALAFVWKGFRQGFLGQLSGAIRWVCGVAGIFLINSQVANFFARVWPVLEEKGLTSLIGYVVAFLIGVILGELVMSIVGGLFGTLHLSFVSRLLGGILALAKLWVLMGVLVLFFDRFEWFGYLFPANSYGYRLGQFLVESVVRYHS